MKRLLWGVGIVLVAIALLVCLVPGHDLPNSLELNDKFSHVIGHAGLAVYFTGLVPRRSWWKIFVFLLVFGAAIELAQYYMAIGREGDPRDLIANSCGAVLGLLLGWLGLERWPQWAAGLLGRPSAP